MKDYENEIKRLDKKIFVLKGKLDRIIAENEYNSTSINEIMNEKFEKINNKINSLFNYHLNEIKIMKSIIYQIRPSINILKEKFEKIDFVIPSYEDYIKGMKSLIDEMQESIIKLHEKYNHLLSLTEKADPQ